MNIYIFAFLSLTVALYSPAFALSPKEGSEATTCFVASTSVESVVRARSVGMPKEEAKATVVRLMAPANKILAAYLADEADLIYRAKPEELPSYALNHNVSCLAVRAPALSGDQAGGCYFYSTTAGFLAKKRDGGMKQEELVASIGKVPEKSQKTMISLIAKVYANPDAKFEPLAEYLACMALH